MKKQLLTFLMIFSLSAGIAQTTVLSENFTARVLPSGWTNDSLGLPATMLWKFTNPGARKITGAGFDTSFAILDSDKYLTGHKQNASLTTSSFSTVGHALYKLMFGESFYYYLPSHHEIAYSINNGVSWTTIRKDSANIGTPSTISSVAAFTTIVLPAGAVGQPNVKLKFTYIATWGYWWALDNIRVIGYDNCSGAPAAGAITGCPSTICPNLPYNMHLVGASGNIGVTYQWMSSPNGTTFTTIPGAIDTIFHDSTATAPKYYQVVVTCATGTTSTTSTVSVTGFSSNSGTITGCPASTCANAAYNLSTVGSSGVSYQWLSSTNGTTYAPITGAVNATLHDSTATVPKYYKVIALCSTFGDTSTAVMISSFNTAIAGTITGCPASVCSGVTYSMSLSGTTGSSYQWLSSTNGTTYSVIGGATNLNYATSTTVAPIYYKAVVSCSPGLYDTTAAVSIVSINPPTQCYCLPTHPACGTDMITNFNIATTSLNNTSTCNSAANGAYTAFPSTGSTTSSLIQGMAYTFNVTTSSNNIISVWIDYNQSGTFDASEWTQVCTTSTATAVNSVAVNIPVTANLGLTGMRVRSRAFGNINGAVNACTAFGSGECEDYMVTIVATTGVRENEKGNFALYPNPASDQVIISLNKTGITNVISVTDLLGNKVMESISTNESSATIALNNLSNGIYIVQVANQYGSTSRKLTVSK